MRALPIVLLYAVLVVILHVAGILAPTPTNWGVHHYGFLPTVWLWGGLLGALVLAGIVWMLARVSKPVRVPAVLVGLLIAAAGAALFWLGRERTTFMGDGRLYLEGVRQGRLLWSSEPGALFLHYHLNRILGSPDPALTFAAVSVACGALYLAIAGAVARAAAPDLGGRALVFGLLALAGLTRLFYGYAETYPLLAVVVMLYLALALRALEGKYPFWPAALVAAIAPIIHLAGLFLWPSLVYALLAGRRAEGETSPPRSDRRPRLLLLLLPLAALLAGMVLRGGYGAFVKLGADYVRGLLPLSGPLLLHVPYTIFSLRHLGDVLQEQWLIGPFGALLVLLLLAFRAHGGLGRGERFLLWAGGPWWVASLLFNRDTGAARDWDEFAVASLPWILLLGLLLARAPRRTAQASWGGAVAAILVGVSLFHTLPWVAIDTSADRSLPHFAALHGPGSRASGFARSYAFEEIGTWYLDRGQSESAVAAYREAATLDTTNARVTANLGAVLLAQGKREEAVAVLKLAVRRDPTREFAQYQLGNAYRDLGREEPAASAYRKALALNPDFVQVTLNYASMERRRGNLVLAEALLTDAMKRAPDNADLRAHMARLQEDKGDTAAAAVGYRDAVAHNPNDTASAFNLGYLLMRQGNTTEASRYFEMVVARAPADAEAWINLGVARDLNGDAAAARTAFERAIAADPRRPEPYFNLAQGYLAARDTASAAGALRSYAALDSTSNMGLLARRLLASMGERGRR